MASNVRIKRNDDGFRAILNSPEVVAELRRRAEAIAAAAGDGMEVLIAEGSGDRPVAFVRAETFGAMRAEATDRALTRALDAGRG